MTPPPSSILVCFIIFTSYFALNCNGQGTRNDLRIGRKEMRYGHVQGHRQAQELGLGQGQSQGLGQGQGSGMGQGQEQVPRDGHEHGQGHDQIQGPGLGQGQEQVPGLGQGHGQGHGQIQGPGLGQGQEQEQVPQHGHEHGKGHDLILGPGLGQGQEKQVPGHGHEHGRGHGQTQGFGQWQWQGQTQGQGQEQGQKHQLGQGLGQIQGPGHGRGQGQEQELGQGHGHIKGPKQGQGPTQGLGQGQGQTQGPGQPQGQGQGQGQTQGQGQGQGQGKKQEEKNENTNENKNKTRVVNIKSMMVFGSSLVDNGNNLFLKTLARPSNLPYGIDFPLGPTGRFTNAKTVIDLFCDHLRLPPLPSFHDPLLKSGQKSIMHGVNFASGGSGIEDLTGVITGQVSSLNKQMDNYQYKIYKALNEVDYGIYVDEIPNNCLFVIGAGGNDYTFNYFLNPVKLRTLVQYTSKIVNELAVQIKRLYNLGARKIVLMGVYPMGCYPKYRNETNCNDEYNRAAVLFNYQLRALIDNMVPAKWPGCRIVFVDTFNIVMDLIKNPHLRGFKNAKDPCCELKPLAAGIGGVTSLCKKEGLVCKDRNSYIFFDGIHPTQAVNRIIAFKAFYSKLPSEVYPMNLSQLSSMDIYKIKTKRD